MSKEIELTLIVRDRNTEEVIIREEAYSLGGLEEKLYRVERAIKEYEEKEIPVIEDGE